MTHINYRHQNSGNISSFLFSLTSTCTYIRTYVRTYDMYIYMYVYIHTYIFSCNPNSKLTVLTIRHRYLTKTVLLKALSKRKMATTAVCSKQRAEGAESFRLVGRLNDLFTSPSSVPAFSAFLSWSCDRRHERDQGEEP